MVEERFRISAMLRAALPLLAATIIAVAAIFIVTRMNVAPAYDLLLRALALIASLRGLIALRHFMVTMARPRAAFELRDHSIAITRPSPKRIERSAVYLAHRETQLSSSKDGELFLLHSPKEGQAFTRLGQSFRDGNAEEDINRWIADVERNPRQEKKNVASSELYRLPEPNGAASVPLVHRWALLGPVVLPFFAAAAYWQSLSHPEWVHPFASILYGAGILLPFLWLLRGYRKAAARGGKAFVIDEQHLLLRDKHGVQRFPLATTKRTLYTQKRWSLLLGMLDTSQLHLQDGTNEGVLRQQDMRLPLNVVETWIKFRNAKSKTV